MLDIRGKTLWSREMVVHFLFISINMWHLLALSPGHSQFPCSMLLLLWWIKSTSNLSFYFLCYDSIMYSPSYCLLTCFLSAVSFNISLLHTTTCICSLSFDHFSTESLSTPHHHTFSGTNAIAKLSKHIGNFLSCMGITLAENVREQTDTWNFCASN